MTDEVTIMRCAYCNRPFSYVPREEDACQPGAPNQICDPCAKMLTEDDEHEGSGSKTKLD